MRRLARSTALPPGGWLAPALLMITSPINHAYNRSPAAPLDRAIRYAAGLQYDVNDCLTIGGACEYIDCGTARVNKQGGPLRGDLKGKYSTNFISIFNLNMIWKF